VVIDSVAAVFDTDAISRRQVRAFCAILRKIANKYDTAIVLLDHPSVRGMQDGSGTSSSVDWRNGPRAMLYLSDPGANVKRHQNFALFEELAASLRLRSLRLFGCIKDRATLRTDLIQMSDHAIPDLSAVGNVGGAEAQGVAHARLPLDSLTRPGLSKGWRDRCAQ
jgi:RecA-family ATPase